MVGNFVRVGPPGNRYLVLEVVNRQYWAAANPRDGSPDMSQARYVQAASPADAQAQVVAFLDVAVVLEITDLQGA